MSSYTKMSRRDYVREGFCPTLNFDYIKPHFYIVKVGFPEYTLFFLFLLYRNKNGQNFSSEKFLFFFFFFQL